MKNILIIPHVPAYKIKVREKEIARHLSQWHNCFFLSWTESYSYTLASRISVSLKDIFKRTTIQKEGKLNIVEFPTLHRPLSLANRFNRIQLDRFCIENSIDIVLSSNYFIFSVPENKKYKYIYDYVDLPANDSESKFGKFVYKITREETKKSDLVIACSQGLTEFVRNQHQREALLVPNGTDLEDFRNVQKHQVDGIKQRYGLNGRFVIGCIGNFGSWMNLGFLIDVFKKLKSEMKDAVLFLVGPGKDFTYFSKKIKDPDIIFAGPVSFEDIHACFTAMDIAVLPNEKSYMQDLAFHIKLIEYTAAKKIIVSANLSEVERLSFPNVVIVPHEVDKWINAIKKARIMKWQESWNPLVDAYDWSNICLKLSNIIDNL